MPRVIASIVGEEGWREVARRSLWDHADIDRLGIQRDTPSLDVRVRPEAGKFIVEVRGPAK